MPKIDDMLNDPDFLSLPENEQNAMIDEMRQTDFKGQPNSIPHPENILKRAAGVMTGDGPIGKMGQGAIEQASKMFMPNIPQNIGDVQSTMGQMSGVGDPASPSSPITTAQGVGGAGINRMIGTDKIKNPLIRTIAEMPGNIAGNPLSYILPAIGAKKLAGAIGEGATGVSNPLRAASKLESGIESAGTKIKSGYKSGLSEMGSKYSDNFTGLTRGKTVSFAEELHNPGSLAEKKLFDAVKEEADFQGIDLDSLTPEESKNVLDMIKGKSKIFEKEIGPMNVKTLKSYQNMKGKQLSAFKDFEGLDKSFGEGIENYNDLSGKASNILEGGGNRITKAAQMKKLEALDPELASSAKNYRFVNAGVKMARNPIVQAAAGIPVVGGAVKAIFGKKS